MISVTAAAIATPFLVVGSASVPTAFDSIDAEALPRTPLSVRMLITPTLPVPTMVGSVPATAIWSCAFGAICAIDALDVSVGMLRASVIPKRDAAVVPWLCITSKNLVESSTPPAANSVPRPPVCVTTSMPCTRNGLPTVLDDDTEFFVVLLPE